MRVPDVGVTCSLDMAGQIALPDPIVLIEIISPGNRKDTWDNVWAYATIPTVAEIVVLQSSRIEAQLFRRDAAGAWPADAAIITSDEMLVLSTIGFNVPLSDFYAQTYLNVS
jgi:Uma2 family endonuclease